MGSSGPWTPRNPFFIRSIVPTDRGNKRDTRRISRNPFFIRSIVPTWVDFYEPGLLEISQSLLHQVNRSNQIVLLFLVNRFSLAIPSSSGQSFQLGYFFEKDAPPTNSQSLLHQVNRSNEGLTQTRAMKNCKLAIPSSSGQSFQHSYRPQETQSN